MIGAYFIGFLFGFAAAITVGYMIRRHKDKKGGTHDQD